jgi:hypothetical protein
MSEQAKHTPGPWTYGIRRDGSIWLSLGDHKTPKAAHYQGDLCATEADARLIAAAPALLEACERLIGRAAYTSEDAAFARAAVAAATVAA